MIMQDENVVPVQAYSQQQAAEMMALRASKLQRFLAAEWESDFLDDIPITFTVHSKHDWQLKEDNTYDLVIDARRDFDTNTNLQDTAVIARYHDGRHPAIARYVRAHNTIDIAKSMALVILVCLDLSLKHEWQSMDCALLCDTGRHRSLSEALWMARVFLVLMKPVSVYMKDEARGRHASRLCRCQWCKAGSGVMRFHVEDAYRVVDMLAGSLAGSCEIDRMPHLSEEGKNLLQLQVCKLVRKIRVVELAFNLRLRDRVGASAPERDASDEEEL